tara:strand:- start:1065 stop:1319 length:255 start_codon:yes stop_codon:yes gene_type:complete
MDLKSLYRTPPAELKKLKKIQMGAYTVKGKNKRDHNYRTRKQKQMSFKEQLSENAKLRGGTLKTITPTVRDNVPVSRYFHSFKL